MPTIAEPVSHPRGAAAWPPSSLTLNGHLAAIRADLADRGVRATPLSVLAHALDLGVPETVAVQLAELVQDVAA